MGSAFVMNVASVCQGTKPSIQRGCKYVRKWTVNEFEIIILMLDKKDY